MKTVRNHSELSFDTLLGNLPPISNRELSSWLQSYMWNQYSQCVTTRMFRWSCNICVWSSEQSKKIGRLKLWGRNNFPVVCNSLHLSVRSVNISSRIWVLRDINQNIVFETPLMCIMYIMELTTPVRGWVPTWIKIISQFLNHH